MDTRIHGVDPVTFEIVSHRLHQVTREMGITLERTGGTEGLATRTARQAGRRSFPANTAPRRARGAAPPTGRFNQKRTAPSKRILSRRPRQARS